MAAEKTIRAALSGADGAAKAAAKNPLLKPRPLPKRFYKQVSAERRDGLYAVLLDGRGVKTPARQALAVPSEALAELAADEFRLQKEVINPALMPITRLCNTVIDAIAADIQPVIEDILRYAACDMVFYRAKYPEALAKLQAENWDKMLDWALEAMGAEFAAAEGIMFAAQKPEALAAASAYLRRWRRPRAEDGRYRAADLPYAVAALHMMVSLTGSALLALMCEAGALSVAETWKLAHLEEDWTIAHWGEDAEAMAKRADAERDFYAAAATLAALKAEKEEEPAAA